MKEIACEVAEDPALLKSAPRNTPISADETMAARQPILKFADET